MSYSCLIVTIDQTCFRYGNIEDVIFPSSQTFQPLPVVVGPR